MLPDRRQRLPQVNAGEAGSYLRARAPYIENLRWRLAAYALSTQPITQRRDTGVAVKGFREVTLVGVAQLRRDFGNGQIGLSEQLLGAFQPPPHDILVRRDAYRALEDVGEVIRAQLDLVGDLYKCQSVTEVRVDERERLLHSLTELRFALAHHLASGERERPARLAKAEGGVRFRA